MSRKIKIDIADGIKVDRTNAIRESNSASRSPSKSYYHLRKNNSYRANRGQYNNQRTRRWQLNYQQTQKRMNHYTIKENILLGLHHQDGIVIAAITTMIGIIRHTMNICDIMVITIEISTRNQSD